MVGLWVILNPKSLADPDLKEVYINYKLKFFFPLTCMMFSTRDLYFSTSAGDINYDMKISEC